MIIIYVSFQLDGAAQAFDSWFVPLVEQTRRADGCISYDYLIDRVESTKRYLFEAWSSEDALEAHHERSENEGHR